jgi:hypothetical protein
MIPIALSSVSYSISITISFAVVAEVDSPFAVPRARASIFSPFTGAITTSLECSSPSKLLSDSKYVRASFARLNASLGAAFVPIVGFVVFVFVARHSTPIARVRSNARQSPRRARQRETSSRRIVIVDRARVLARTNVRFASRFAPFIAHDAIFNPSARTRAPANAPSTPAHVSVVRPRSTRFVWCTSTSMR